MNFEIVLVLLVIAVIVFGIGVAIGFASSNELANMRMERIEDDLIHIINYIGKEHLTDDSKAEDKEKESGIEDGKI
jgi:hypothetical protein